MKFLNNIFSLFKSLLSDERGMISSKRVVGIMCAIFLCISLYKSDSNTSSTLISSVATLSAACLGFTSLDKIFFKEGEAKEDNKNE